MELNPENAGKAAGWLASVLGFVAVALKLGGQVRGGMSRIATKEYVETRVALCKTDEKLCIARLIESVDSLRKEAEDRNERRTSEAENLTKRIDKIFEILGGSN